MPSAVSSRQKKKEAAAKAAKLDTGSTTRLLGGETGVSYGTNEVSHGVDNDYPVESGVVQPVEREPETPPPFRALLIPQVLIPLSVYMVLAFIDMSCLVLQPLMYSTSISLGGLGFDPYRIGVIMGIWGVINVIFQLSFLARFIRRFGPKNMLIFVMISYVSVLGLYPLLSFFAQRSGKVDTKVWAVIIIQLTLQLTVNMGYGMC